MRTIPSADPPCISVRLRKPRYAESADNDLRRSGGHTGPEYLLDVVCAIEPVCGAHVAVAFRAVGCDDDQIEVVLKVRAGGVGPGEGYLKRRPQAGRTRIELAAVGCIFSPRRLGGMSTVKVSDFPWSNGPPAPNPASGSAPAGS